MLTVDALSFSFRKLKLFQNLSFQVAPGEIVLLHGPNGVGKSTLLALLSGALKPDSGKITWDIPTSRTDFLDSEHNHLFLKRSAWHNLQIWLDLQGIKRSDSEILAELKSWRLNHPFFATELPVERFSTGMKRRLSLARLYLSARQLWLLDEPLFGLDVDAIAVFREKLARHLDSQGAVIVVSHDLRPFEDFPLKRLNLDEYRGQK